MKKILSILLALTMLLAAMPAALAAVYPELTAPETVKVGDTVTVKATLDQPIEDNVGFEYWLYYDASVYQLKSSTPGEVFPKVELSNPMSSDGRNYYKISGSTDDSLPVTLPAGTLYTFEFEAIKDGAASFSMSKETVMNGSYEEDSSETAAVPADKAATATVTVQPKDAVAVETVTVSPETATMEVGEEMTLTAAVAPDNADDQTVEWKSSNDAVATVDENGKVTAIAAGEATITATAGGKSGSCVVTVNKPAVSVQGWYASIGENAEVKQGETVVVKPYINNSEDAAAQYSAFQFEVQYDAAKLKYTGYTGTDAKGEYSVKDDNGTLTIKGIGSAKTVSESAAPIELSFQAIASGDAVVTLNRAWRGTSAEATSENIAKITVAEERSSITVRIPEDLTVSFNEKVTVDGVENNIFTVASGSDLTFTVKKNADETVTVEVGGAVLEPNEDGSYTIKNITESQNVEITRVGKTYNVTMTGDGAGDAKYEKTATAGTQYDFTVTEDSSYTYSYEATVNGKTVDVHGGNGSYYIAAEDVTGDITITIGKTKKGGGTTETYKYTLYIDGVQQSQADVTSGSAYTASGVDTDKYAIVSATMNGVDVKDRLTLNKNSKTATFPAATGDLVLKLGTIYSVTLPDGVTGADKANYGSDYTFTVPAGSTLDEVTVGGKVVTPTDNGDGSYTIPGDKITGDIVVKTKAGDDVTVYVNEYVKLDGKSIMLVTAKSDKLAEGRIFAYDGANMFYSEKYKAYAYLVITDAGLSVDEAKTHITEIEAVSESIVYEGNDVNMSGNADLNDAQLVYDMYNVMYDSFESVSMMKFLRADVNGDAVVDVLDVRKILG